MGLLVVGLNVWCAQSAGATPVLYSLGGGLATGTFILDRSLLQNPFIDWNINFDGQTFNNLTDTVNLNTSPCPDCTPLPSDPTGLQTFELASINHNGTNLAFITNFSNNAVGIGPNPLPLPSNNFGLITSPNSFQCLDMPCVTGAINTVGPVSVPEPPPGVLLMLGLLVLAGARWWTRRREGLQRG
jgi:MYXO-CTERM domain-containing protein